MRYIPQTLEQRGLKNYLDTTTDQHNGHGYDDFITMLDGYKRYKLAEKFNVDRDTIRRWVKLYEKEQSNPVRRNK